MEVAGLLILGAMYYRLTWPVIAGVVLFPVGGYLWAARRTEDTAGRLGSHRPTND